MHINDAPSDKYTAHRKWASKTHHSAEPQNIHINAHTKLIDAFVERFIEVADRKPSIKEVMAQAEQRAESLNQETRRTKRHKKNSDMEL